jgi:hypothetical protein
MNDRVYVLAHPWLENKQEMDPKRATTVAPHYLTAYNGFLPASTVT